MATASRKTGTPKAQLDGFIDEFTPAVAKDARAALAKMKKRLPTADVLVYDNYNALAIGFAPGERASAAIFSLAVFQQRVTLCFLQGAKLTDPAKRLKGSGTTVRHVRLTPLSVFDDAEILELMDAALANAKVPLASSGRGKLIVKSISAKQRPRQPVVKPPEQPS